MTKKTEETEAEPAAAEDTNPKLLVPINEIPITTQTIMTMMGTPTVPKRYKKWEDAWATVLHGRELGVGPITALNSIYMIDGSTSMYVKLMQSLVQRQGHYIRFDELTSEKAVVHAMRKVDGGHDLVGVFEYTIEDAELAGFAGKDTYKKHPKSLLGKQAISMACRMAFPECLAGIVHIPEEVGVDESLIVEAELVEDGEVMLDA